MLENRSVAVVVPAYNEERQIRLVLETMPEFVDRVIVVDDASEDGTVDVVLEFAATLGSSILEPPPDRAAPSGRYDGADRAAVRLREEQARLLPPTESVTPRGEHSRLVLLRHRRNQGVGAGIATGYQWCRENRIECTAVMAGDGQMDPRELRKICEPVIRNEVDYVKGNRLIHQAAHLVTPKVRHFGNSVLSILTKVASGYWHVSDTQTGFTAISLTALDGIQLHEIYPRYGMPNDLLIRLNTGSFPIREVPIRPVYGVGENSKMRIGRVIPSIVLLLVKGFFRRLFTKYLVLNFHPLFLCYGMFFVLSLLDMYLLGYLIQDFFVEDVVNDNYLIVTIFVSILLVQFLLFGMWFDMQDNERLQK